MARPASGRKEAVQIRPARSRTRKEALAMAISTAAKAFIGSRQRAERIRKENARKEETRAWIASLTPEELEAEQERIYEKLCVGFAADWDHLCPEIREIAIKLGVTGPS
jgi:hypothetical protein